MAGFDKTLDVEIFGVEAKFETSKIKVSIMSYNEGAKKLQISREILDMNTGDYKWSKLGRLNKEEVEAVLPLIKEAYEHM